MSEKWGELSRKQKGNVIATYICIFISIFLVFIYPFYFEYGLIGFFRHVFYIVLNPIFWVSIVVPTILIGQSALLNMNINKMEANILLNESKEVKINGDMTKEELKKLKEIINSDATSVSWNDFNNQTFAVLLSFIFGFIETVSALIKLHFRSNTSMGVFMEVLLNDITSIFLLSSLLIIIIWFLFFELLSGKLVTVKNFKRYVDIFKNKKNDGISAPPRDSRLTVMRYVIIMYASILMIWRIWIVSDLERTLKSFECPKVDIESLISFGIILC